MESTVLVDSKVQADLMKLVRVALFIDRANDEERANRRLLAEKFGNATIPAYYLLDPDGKQLAAQVGPTDEAGFRAFLAKGL